ncbi:hypothetical protein CBOM_01032 [Ceraceosorus bombacis]|uniref:Uncharacterized protein n=1 Tax=Ceraceosorus bombacis TaxID=401625 RepID=A0A0P1BAX7_9BASI|nr:hypothetical protein CBOM_01032 [Ceraceosorus bombacis]
MKNAALLSAMVLAAVTVRALPTATLADHLIKGRSVDNAQLRARGTSTREGEQSFLRTRNSASAHLPGMDHVADEVQLARSLVQEGSDYASLGMVNGKRDVSPATDALDARRTPPGVSHNGYLGPIFNGKRELAVDTKTNDGDILARRSTLNPRKLCSQDPAVACGGGGWNLGRGRRDLQPNAQPFDADVLATRQSDDAVLKAREIDFRVKPIFTPEVPRKPPASHDPPTKRHVSPSTERLEARQKPVWKHRGGAGGPIFNGRSDATSDETIEARQGDGKNKLRWSDHPQHIGKRDLEPTQSLEVRGTEEMDHQNTIVTRSGSLGRREPMPSPVPQPKKQRGNSQQANVQKNHTKASHGQTQKATRKPKKTKVGYVYPASKDPLAAF